MSILRNTFARYKLWRQLKISRHKKAVSCSFRLLKVVWHHWWKRFANFIHSCTSHAATKLPVLGNSMLYVVYVYLAALGRMLFTSGWAATSTTALIVVRNRTLVSVSSGRSGKARPAIDHGLQHPHSPLLFSHLGRDIGRHAVQSIWTQESGTVCINTMEGAHSKDNEIVAQHAKRFMENTVHCTRWWCSAAGSNRHNKSAWKSSRSVRR